MRARHADGPLTGTRPTGGALSLAVAPGGSRLATGGADHAIPLLDTVTWRPAGTHEGHRGWVVSLAFDPTGRLLASGSKDQTVKLWTDPGRDARTLLGHTQWPSSLAFAPDGRTLATGRALLTLPGQGGPVGFADGGAALLTADLAGRAFLSRP